MRGIPRIVILGAGFGGLTLASRLDELAAKGKAEVTLVERNSALSVGGLFQFSLRGELDPSMIPMAYEGGNALKTRHVRFYNDEVTAVDVEGRTVHTRSSRLDFDYLVITTGARYAPEGIPGLASAAYNVCHLADVLQLKETLARHRGGRIVMSVPRTPYKCPTVPQEYVLIVETMLREAGVRDDTEIIFTTEADGPFPMTGFFLERFKEYGISCVPFAPIQEVDPVGRRITFAEGRTGDTVDAMDYDLLMATYPLAADPAFASLCDDTQLIPSDPRSLKTAWEGVYAFGDCAGMRLASGPLHPKAGAFAMCQAEALASNLRALVESGGESDAGAENLGIAKCDAEVGNNEGASVSVNLMGGPKSQFELSPVSAQAVEDKIQWIRDCVQIWFRGAPPF